MDKKLDAILEKELKGNSRYLSYVETGSWIYPAEEFERETGLKGISRQYTIPDGQSSEEAHFHLLTKEIKMDMAATLVKSLQQMGAPVNVERAEAYNAVAKDELSDLKKRLKELQNNNGDEEEIESLAVDFYRAQSRVSYAKTLNTLVGTFGDALEGKLKEATIYLRQDYERSMVGFYDKLEALNPELKVIPVDRSKVFQLRNVVDGALSHFNVSDINAFSIERFTGVQARQDAEWVKNNEAIEKATGTTMYWIASKTTQEHTLSQLAEKTATKEGSHAQREVGRRELRSATGQTR